MASGLQEQRVGDDGADRGKRQRAGNHVFRAVQQHAHRKAPLGLGFHGSRLRAATAARHVVIDQDYF